MDRKLSHAEDLRLFSTRASLVAFAALMALLVVAPFVLPGWRIFALNQIAIHIVLAVGLNLLVGTTGLISLGHAAFLAVGAYTSVVLVGAGVPFVAALVAAGAVSGALGFVVGLPALRLEGPYLTIATMGFGIATQQLLGYWESLTGGHMGLHTPPISIAGVPLATDAARYGVIMPVTVLCVIAGYNIQRSRVGRALAAIRDSDVAAQASGVDLTAYKTRAFAISTFFAGLAGSLYAHNAGFIAPENFDLFLSIKMLAMVVVGGLGSVLGSVLGPSLLVGVELAFSGAKAYSAIIVGAVMIVVVLFEPAGLRGRWLTIKRYWKSWPF